MKLQKLLSPLLCLSLLFSLPAFAEPDDNTCPAAADQKDKKDQGDQKGEKVPDKPEKEEKPKESKGSVKIGGSELRYTTSTGTMPILNDEGKVRANIFYVYYAATDSKGKRLAEASAAQRPITFCFNGGPGSSAVWLHLGGLGPKRVEATLENKKPTPITNIVDNPNTLLDSTDLVFIDPVATGLSRPAKGEKEDQFLGVNEDIECVGEFIRLFTTREQRWASPKFLCGESYGGIRGAGLTEYLESKHGLYLNGLMIISGLLNYQNLSGAPGNEIAWALSLPAFTATAYYHKKLGADLQNGTLEQAVTESRKFAFGDYLLALFKGNTLGKEERKRIASQLGRLTSLPEDLILDQELRPDSDLFRRMLLKKEGKIIGGYDARILAEDNSNFQNGPEFDPSASFVRGGISASINNYVRTTLGYQSDLPYRVMAPVPWNWKSYSNRYVSMEEKLAKAMKENPSMKVLLLVGRRDLVVPWESMKYSVDHLSLPESLRANIQFAEYESGHMMYFNPPDAVKLHKDAADFISVSK
jgi:carboxypeptidase C (cathepsin A)